MTELDATESIQESTLSDPSQETQAFASPYLAQPQDSYTKLAMKNMVRRGGTSLFHFALTLVGLVGVLVGLSVLFH